MTVALVTVTCVEHGRFHVTRDGGRTTLCGRDAATAQLTIIAVADLARETPGVRICRTCGRVLRALEEA